MIRNKEAVGRSSYGCGILIFKITILFFLEFSLLSSWSARQL